MKDDLINKYDAALPDDKLQTFRETLDDMSLSVISFLTEHEGVQDVTLSERPPVKQPAIDKWEAANYPLKLPNDFKAFLQTSDGLLLQWNVVFRGRVLPFGCMHLNKLEDVKPVQSSSFCADYIERGEVKAGKPSDRKILNRDRKPFDLDNLCPTGGSVALMYTTDDENPEVWFRDLANQWFFIAKSFTDYFRLMVSHLGVPHWQYAFTTAGLDPITLQWFAFLSPERLQIDMEYRMKRMRINTENVRSLATRRVVPLGAPSEVEKQKSRRSQRGENRWSGPHVPGHHTRRRRKKTPSGGNHSGSESNFSVKRTIPPEQMLDNQVKTTTSNNRPFSAPLRRK